MPQTQENSLPHFRKNKCHFFGKSTCRLHGIDRRLAMHVIIEFSPEEAKQLDLQSALEIGYSFALTQFPDYMCFFAVHDNTDLLHIHLLLVTCDIYSGDRFAVGTSGWFRIGNEGNRILESLIGPENVSPVQVTYGSTPRKKRRI